MLAALAANSLSVLTHHERCRCRQIPSWRNTRHTACTEPSSFAATAGLALPGRGLYVAGGGGRADDGFDRSEVGGEMGVAQAGKQFLDRRETALQNETEDATIPAHLAARDVMIFVRLQAGIKHGCDLRLRLQETGDLERALVLLANAEVQGLHSAQQQVGGHGIEG